MNSNFFSNLLPELSTRAARATLGRLGFSNPPLRRHLLSTFSRGYGEAGCFLGDPVFEATFGWKQAAPSMAQLAKSLLHPEVVAAMDKPWGDRGHEYQFPKSSHPYTHQLTAWQTLLSPGYQSVVITSGTGSGKTECFMVPVMSSIAKARENGNAVNGVRALFLYPLNALIQSQRERLRAWTGPFGGDMRFCLYNGMTPDVAKATSFREAPNEVHDRVTLRENPPPILVTNPTMLEYMLVRAQDAPILEKSQGNLEWIVLDEAHNYVGSQAAELALLLRRVIHAFGTSADKIRFIATSATMGNGDDEAKKQLQEFLAKLAGIPTERVVVIEGERQIPDLLEPLSDCFDTPTPSELSAIVNDEDRYLRLAALPLTRQLRSLFVPAKSGQTFQPLSVIKGHLKAANLPAGDNDALEWLDLFTSATKGTGRMMVPFLPLRLHAFHNTLNGLWACVDPNCPTRLGTELDSTEWPFGMVYTAERSRCGCGSPAYPLISCNDCNETFLRADLIDGGGIRRLVPPAPEDDIDEFKLDQEPEESEIDDDSKVGISIGGLRTSALIVNGQTRGMPITLNRDTLELMKKTIDSALSLRIQDLTLVDKELALRCPCCDGNAHLQEQFRKPMLGAQFLLSSIIPTLLEFCPDGEQPLASPLRGRRMITFTDSRQGTARIAAQTQQDSERNAVRTAVYRKLVTATSASTGETEEIKQKICTYRTALTALAGQAQAVMFEKFIGDEEEKLKQLGVGKVITHKDMVAWLASQVSDVGRWIHEYYAESDSLFRAARGKELLTEILLCREFARRPKRQNSLETLGLVAIRYPKFALITSRRSAVELAGLSLAEWIDFLKISLDFVVRQSMCLKLPVNWERWGGNHVYSKQMLPPKSNEKLTSKLTRWPRVLPGARQNRLVRILAFVLKVDPQTETGRNRIDSLLLAAWEDLTMTTGLLQLGGGQGRYLDMEDMAFQNISQAWVCPVTRRILDTTLRGVTPYLPEKQVHDGVAICRTIEIPVCDVIAKDFADDDERVAAARAWVDSQPSLLDARVEGIWSNISDRIIEGAGYYRAVEHSAQQSGKRLEQYEAQFKRGAINLMSCSTTMEMGVDIGGINMVAMNNVPPHPANYLQRAGRAGRRAETRSVALTVCKNNPHDQHVFAHTTWPFVTRLATPGISLSSPLIVQRHINSFMLACFLRAQSSQGKLDKLTLEWWMMPRGSSRQERFVAWLECFDSDKNEKVLSGLRALVKRTVFDGQSSFSTITNEVGRFSKAHADKWLSELRAIDEQLATLIGKDTENKIPLKALQIQRKRLTGEYLLRELATSGFLPGYGFPTDITTFETLNKDSAELVRAREHSASGREDNKFHRRELPSRDTVTALREYAPGASVVIDGLVYESAGITLNWHAPATLDAINELQNIRLAWRCSNCGSSGTTVRAAHLDQCPECGTELSRGCTRPLDYLEPAGFSVDLFAETHNDVSLQKYIPVELPWISVQGQWIALANAALGRFRSSTHGSVFHYSSGLGGSGYALCLECGRAAPMGYREDAADIPKIFKHPHKRLRGRQGGNDWVCAGSDNPFKIKTGIRFGREYTTDALELTLSGTDGQTLVDITVAYTIAVALRRAIANHLGVDETELGCDTKEIRDEQDRCTRVIQIYDVRSAGYSSLVTSDLPKLLRAARQNLECEQSCESACQSCLLTYDTRFRGESLDRKAALSFLTAEWIDSLALSEDNLLFGPISQAEYQPIVEAITRELNRSNSKRLFVYLNGDPVDWDLPKSPIRRMLHRLSANSDVKFCIVVNQADIDKISIVNAGILTSLARVCDVDIRSGRFPQLRTVGSCLATIETSTGTFMTWASRDISSTVPTESWGVVVDHPIVAAATGCPEISDVGTLLLSSNSVSLRIKEITHQLDGNGAGFGSRFWNLFVDDEFINIFSSTRVLRSITYEDRYLATPIACALLVDILSALKVIHEKQDRWSDVEINIFTGEVNSQKFVRSRDQWRSDWPSTTCRDKALNSAFEYCGMRVGIVSKPCYELIHGRRMSLIFHDDTRVAIWLDQGLGYWSMSKQQIQTPLVAFPMSHPSDLLGEKLAEIKIGVEGHDLPTQLFIDLAQLE